MFNLTTTSTVQHLQTNRHPRVIHQRLSFLPPKKSISHLSNIIRKTSTQRHNCASKFTSSQETRDSMSSQMMYPPFISQLRHYGIYPRETSEALKRSG